MNDYRRLDSAEKLELKIIQECDHSFLAEEDYRQGDAYIDPEKLEEDY